MVADAGATVRGDLGYYVSPPEFSDISDVGEIFHWARKLMEPTRFVLDEARFLADLEPAPAFLSAPSPEYLQAADIMPILAALAGR